jgi:hypothetical protein
MANGKIKPAAQSDILPSCSSSMSDDHGLI